MSPQHLLEQARLLLNAEATGRPRQASLRRALSTAYYALFHALIDGSCRTLIGGQPRRRELRAVVARCFDHAAMRDACRGFSAGNPPAPLAAAMSRPKVDPRLRAVAAAFVLLQELRHAADYDRMANFSRPAIGRFITTADQAVAQWEEIVGDDDTRVFVAALLLRKQMRS